jgi:hypothetical protein
MVLELTRLVQAVMIIAFASYGAGCFLSAQMIAEYERFGSRRLRLWTGGLQIAGSVGLLVGYCSRPLLVLAAGGFVVMMSAALLVRWRLRDTLRESLPAVGFLVLSIFLVVSVLRLGGWRGG